MCGAQRYERSPDRIDTRAGNYERTFHSKAGEVKLKMPQVSAMLKAIHAQESGEAAQDKAKKVVEEFRAMRLQKAADLVERCLDETLGYYSYPQTHWLKIRTNNPLERIMREIRRRTRVVGAFPDGV
jgi:transposase-like protein